MIYCVSINNVYQPFVDNSADLHEVSVNSQCVKHGP